MGNTPSTQQVSLDDFKDQIFSQVVFFISKYANHELEFKPESECDANFLPQLKDRDFQAIINYYQGGSGDLDYHIDNYLNEHVLNNIENATRFHKILMAKLSQDSDDLEEQDASDDDIDVMSVASNVEQFIKKYEDPRTSRPPDASGASVKLTPSNPSGPSVTLTSRPSNVSGPSTVSIKSNKPDSVKPHQKTALKIINNQSYLPDDPEIESVSSSKLGFSRSNMTANFSQFEVPESEYPESVKTNLSKLVKDNKTTETPERAITAGFNEKVEPVNTTTSTSKTESENQSARKNTVELESSDDSPEDQLEEPDYKNLSDEELSECLVSRI